MPSDGTQKKKSSGWQRCGSSRVLADTGNVAAGAAGWAVEAVQTLSILPDEDNFPWGKLFWKRPQGNTPSLVITLLLCDWFRQMWVSQLSLWLWLCGSNGGAPTAQAPCPVMCCDTQLLICRTGEPRIQGNVSCGHKCAAEEVATLWLEAVVMSGRWLCPQDSSEGSVMWPVVGSLLEVSDPNTQCSKLWCASRQPARCARCQTHAAGQKECGVSAATAGVEVVGGWEMMPGWYLLLLSQSQRQRGFSSEAVRGYANMIAHRSSSTQLGPQCLLLSIRKERSLYMEKSLGKLSLYFEAVRAFLYVCALFLCLFLCIGSRRPPKIQFIEQYSKLDNLRYDWKEKLSQMWRGRKGKWMEDLPSCQPPRATLSELIRQKVIGQNLCWVPLRYSGSNICFYSNIQKRCCLEALQKIWFIFFPFQIVIYTTLTPTSLSLRNK